MSRIYDQKTLIFQYFSRFLQTDEHLEIICSLIIIIRDNSENEFVHLPKSTITKRRKCMTYSAKRTPKLYDIINEYYKQNGGPFMEKDRQQEMVQKMIDVYKKMPFDERKDVLIPADACFLEQNPIKSAKRDNGEVEYELTYTWNEPDLYKDVYLEPGMQLDRIGNAYGNYFCPKREKSYPIQKRALPYFFFEEELNDIRKCASYHVYVVRSNMKASQGIAKDFLKSTGGCQEIKTTKKVFELLKESLLEEDCNDTQRVC